MRTYFKDNRINEKTGSNGVSFEKQGDKKVSQKKQYDIENLGEIIGTRIVSLRGRRSSGELATDAGISKSIISKIENGGMVPSLESLLKICNVLGICIEEVLR